MLGAKLLLDSVPHPGQAAPYTLWTIWSYVILDEHLDLDDDHLDPDDDHLDPDEDHLDLDDDEPGLDHDDANLYNWHEHTAPQNHPCCHTWLVVPVQDWVDVPG